MNSLLATDLKLRKATPIDFDSIEFIDRCSYFVPFKEGYFDRVSSLKKTHLIAIQLEERVVGFIDYKLYKDIFAIRKFAIDPNFRGKGYGTYVLDLFKSKLSQGYRSSLKVLVDERLVEGQIFLKNRKLKAELPIYKEYYGDYDAYCMAYYL